MKKEIVQRATKEDPHLRFAQTVKVGNVKGITSSGRVDSPCAAFLQPQVVKDFAETWVL